MRPAEVARRGADYLRRHGVDAPQAAAESEVLLQRVLGVGRTELFTREAGLSTAEAKADGRACSCGGPRRRCWSRWSSARSRRSTRRSWWTHARGAAPSRWRSPTSTR